MRANRLKLVFFCLLLIGAAMFYAGIMPADIIDYLSGLVTGALR